MSPTQSHHYIDNPALTKILTEWSQARKHAIQTKQPVPPIPDQVAEAALLIATKLSRKGNFLSYTYRDDMIGDGLMAVTLYVKNFDATKCRVGGAFAYLSQIVHSAFLRRIASEQKAAYTRAKFIEHVKGFDHQDGDEGHYVNTLQQHFIETGAEVITSYEERLKRKREQAKEAIARRAELAA
ncbi:MAG TPA: hypothetical protein VGN17_00515 [Bryobacteraceae bacterium]|jgi:hypothetical protein